MVVCRIDDSLCVIIQRNNNFVESGGGFRLEKPLFTIRLICTVLFIQIAFISFLMNTHEFVRSV